MCGRTFTPRRLDRLVGLREWNTLSIFKKNWLEIIFYGVMHDRTVPVAFDAILESVHLFTGRHLANSFAWHLPITEAVEVCSKALVDLFRREMDERVASILL